MTRNEAIAEELRRMGDKTRPDHDDPDAVRAHVRKVLELRGLPAHTEHLGHADLYQLAHAGADLPLAA